MKILGISAYYHDSAAALIENGVVKAAAQEERFSRKKHDESFPKNAIKFCLEENELTLSDIDSIVFYDKPFLKFERLIQTYYETAPKGLFSFIKAMPVWLKEKLFLKATLKKALKEIGEIDFNQSKLLFSEHHLSHAAGAFYPSGFDKAAILTIDGVGEYATTSIAIGEGQSIKMLKEIHFPDSLGLLYSSFTYFLGFKVNSGEYKLMGLAPYGDPKDSQTQQFVELIKNELCCIYEDGSIKLNQQYFKFAWGLKMIQEKKWQRLFGFSIKCESESYENHHFNLASAIQQVTEEIILKLANHAKTITKCDYLCLSGGVALNCVANGRLIQSKLYKDIFIQPASGDAGGAIGAALAVSNQYYQEDKKGNDTSPVYLGPSFSDLSIKRTLDRYKFIYHYVDDNALIKQLIATINNGDAVALFRGKMEFGPRALGHRSILASAISEQTQKKLNLQVKKRESFRPFAPILLEEEAKKYFESGKNSPYMLLVDWLKEEHRYQYPTAYFEQSLSDRLYFKRSALPAITHIDYSARLQTINKENDSFLYELLMKYKEQAGVGLMVNTSFNLRGEPIVCSPEDALKTFMHADISLLCLENFIILKSENEKVTIKSPFTIID